MLIAVLTLLSGLLLLLWAADRFVDGAATIAAYFRVSPMIIGMTIVSLGTSLPEMIVSAIAALDGNRDLGIGNVLGSNIANVGLVLGMTALLVPFPVRSMTVRREIPVLMLVTALAFVLMADGSLGRMDGMALLAATLVLLAWLARISLRDRHDPLAGEFEAAVAGGARPGRAAFFFAFGLIMLFVSSKMVVWGASEIARFLGVGDLLIGLTVVAIGTSLPELVASVACVLKGRADMAVGNVIGSNMFNLLLVLAMPALAEPGAFAPQALLRDFPVMLAFTLALPVVCFALRGRGRVGRVEGGVLVAAYAAYLCLLRP